MKIGTKSLLFGYHQFLFHPLMVAISWWRLYGFPFDPRLWVAFLVHDIGYWGKPNMDGPEGETHPVVGAQIMHRLFDWPRIKNYPLQKGGYSRDYNYRWLHFTLFHSRFYAKGCSQPTSKLCRADKAVILILPWWIQLGLMNATGEIHEYMKGQNGRTTGIGRTQREWLSDVRLCLEQNLKEDES